MNSLRSNTTSIPAPVGKVVAQEPTALVRKGDLDFCLDFTIVEIQLYDLGQGALMRC